MRTHRFLPLLAAAILAAGCTRNDDPGGGDPGAVQLRASIAQPSGTRTTDGGDEWEDGDRVGIFMTEAGTNTAIYANRLHTVTDHTTGALSADGAPMLYPQSGDVDFIAYYPWRSGATLGTPLNLTVTGQSGVDEQNDLDVLYVRKGGVGQSADPVGLEFDHVLSKITFDMTLIQMASGEVTEVVFGGMPASARLDLTDGSLAPGPAGYIAALEAATADDADATFTTLVVPQPLGGAGRTAIFTVDGYDYVLNISENDKWEPGRHYHYPVTITAFDARVNVGPVTIIPWEPADHDPEAAIQIISIDATFADGTTGTCTGMKYSDGTHTMVFEGDKLIYSVTIEDVDYLIGRRANETITLKIDALASEVVFRAPDGDGKIPIGTYAEFAMINTDAASLDDDYLQEADIDLLGVAEQLAPSLTPQIWTPTGTSGSPFTGSYDGGNHTISNLYVDSDQDYSGLFGYVGSGGSLSRIGVVSGSVTGANWVGGVCGWNSNGNTISDSYNMGTVTGTGNYVGGVCGYNNLYATLTRCYNTGKVSGANAVGGVCGMNDPSATITYCHNDGEVSGDDSVGGLCGYNEGSIFTANYNTGKVTGTRDNVGGVCGHNFNGTIIDSNNTGEVSGTGEYYVGGVCGRSTNSIITDCHNMGAVTGTNWVGGVCGWNSNTISDSYNKGTVTGTGNYVGGVCGYNNLYATSTRCYNTGKVSGANAVGGVCGMNDPSATITSCHNEGEVSGNDSVGGVCGYSESYAFTACYNTGDIEGVINAGGVCGNIYAGTITACYNKGAVLGKYAGGVCGMSNLSTITACFSTGAVSGEYAGGVCGWNENNSTITASWFLQRDILADVGGNAGIAEVTTFGPDAWPEDAGEWAVRDSDTLDGHWKALSPDPLGGWIGTGTPTGADSTFPRLWWEQ